MTIIGISGDDDEIELSSEMDVSKENLECRLDQVSDKMGWTSITSWVFV